MTDADITVPGYNVVLRGCDDLSKAIPLPGTQFPLHKPKPKPLTEDEKALKELQEMNGKCGFIFTFPMPEAGPTPKQLARLERHRQQTLKEVEERHSKRFKDMESRRQAALERTPSTKPKHSCRQLAEERQSVEVFGGSLGELLEMSSQASCKKRERPRTATAATAVNAPKHTSPSAKDDGTAQGPKPSVQADVTAQSTEQKGGSKFQNAAAMQTLAEEFKQATVQYDKCDTTAVAALLGIDVGRAKDVLDGAHDGLAALRQALASIQAYNGVIQRPSATPSTNTPTSSVASSSNSYVPRVANSERSAAPCTPPTWDQQATSSATYCQRDNIQHIVPSDVPRNFGNLIKPIQTHYRVDTQPSALQAENDMALLRHTESYPPPSSPPTRARAVRQRSTSAGASSSSPFALAGAEAPAWRPSRRVLQRQRAAGVASSLQNDDQRWEINDFSYENLLELGSMAVSLGLTKQQISRIPCFTYQDGQRQGLVGSAECSVCLEPFCSNDMCMSLICGHGFHETCIVPWLLRNNKCPCCRHDVARPKFTAAPDPPYQMRPV